MAPVVKTAPVFTLPVVLWHHLLVQWESTTRMVTVIVWIVLLAATQVPQDHRLALCVLTVALQVPQDHGLALMSQRVPAVKSALVITLPAVLRHQSLVQLESTVWMATAIVFKCPQVTTPSLLE